MNFKTTSKPLAIDRVKRFKQTIIIKNCICQYKTKLQICIEIMHLKKLHKDISLKICANL